MALLYTDADKGIPAPHILPSLSPPPHVYGEMVSLGSSEVVREAADEPFRAFGITFRLGVRSVPRALHLVALTSSGRCVIVRAPQFQSGVRHSRLLGFRDTSDGRVATAPSRNVVATWKHRPSLRSLLSVVSSSFFMTIAVFLYYPLLDSGG